MHLKSKKTLWPTIRFALSIYWKERKSLLIICGLAVIARVALPYLSILMPKIVIDQISAATGPITFMITVGVMVLLIIAVNYLKAFTDQVTNRSIGSVGILKTLANKLYKRMTMDYELMNDPAFKTVQDMADKATLSNHSPAMNVPRTMVELLTNSLGFALYAGVIVLINPLIMLLLTVSAAISWLMLYRARKYMESTREDRGKLLSKLGTLSDSLRRPEAAKDIRMYRAFDWLTDVYKTQHFAHIKAERAVLSKNMHAQLTDTLLILLRDGGAYAFLIWMVFDGRMSLGDFIYIFAAVGSLAGWVSGILISASDLSKACIEMSDIKAMLDYPDRMNTGPGIAIHTGRKAIHAIELRDVSYTYPGADTPILSSINVIIEGGERIAIVGVNGAGKTTLIKLICGLYIPTDGEVLLNGNAINAYNRDEYYKMFSTVFQDVNFLASSIAENISQKPIRQTDLEKVRHCLELAGLKECIGKLPEKENSLLVREVHRDAVELSGGEKQKLIMARALYKNAPILILDEPTAALDPIAESEIYQKYAELTRDKTSIYISHRLASTRFCDRILHISGGVIAEQGTHDELMAAGGNYSDMFRIQASYYKSDIRT